MKTLELQQRNNKIRQWRKDGKTFSWIGKETNLHPERVRQICLTSVDRELKRNQLIVTYKEFLNSDVDYQKLLNQIYALSLPDRKQETVEKRRILVRHLHDNLNVSFYKIAILLKRNHSSISNLYYNKV